MRKEPTKYALLLLLWSIPILFAHPMEDVIDRTITKPVFGNFHPTIFSDVIFFLAVACILYFLISSLIIKRFIEWQGIVYVTFIAFYFAIYKFKWFGFNHWAFIPLKYVSWLSYIDLIVFAPLFLIAHKLIRRPIKKAKKDSSYVLMDDSHIQNVSADELNRKGLANHVADYIHNSESKNQSTAIAINAKWGDGKTSFQKMVAEFITDKDKNAIVIDFNPWRSANEDKIIKDFFELYADHIRVFDLRLGDQILRYGNRLMSETNGWWKFVSLDSLFQIKSEDQFENINDSLDRVGRKVIVLIDDLDRLSFKEILEVVKLIRNSANFKNTFFIVGYDEEYMHEALKHHNEYGKENFLEKIFQIQFDLSQVEQEVIKKKLAEYLSICLVPQFKVDIQAVIYPQTNESEMISTVFLGKTIPDQFIPRLLTNMRDVKRFVNYFALSIKLVSTEVVFSDYFYLSLLKFRFPLLIKRILKSEHKYVEKKFSDLFQYQTIKEEPLRKLMNELEIEEFDQDTIIQVFKTLYEPSKTAPERRSILFPDNFFLYYDNALNTKGVLYGEIVPLLDKSWPEIEGQIVSWLKEGKGSFLINILKDIDSFSSSDRFTRVSKLWVLLTNFNYDPDRNVAIWLDQISKNKAKVQTLLADDLKPFFNSLFETKKGSIFFYDTYVCRLILRKYVDGKDYYFPLNKETVQKISVGRLKQFIDTTTGFDMRAFNSFYYNCWDFKTDDSAVRIVKEANEAILNYVNQHPDDYLRFTIRSKSTPHLDNEYTFEPFTPQYFGDWNKFKEFLTQRAGTNSEFVKMVEYFDAFAKNNYKVFYTEDPLPWIGADKDGNSIHTYFKDQTYIAFLNEMHRMFNPHYKL